MFGDAQVLKSYFYGIADVAVGARCKCNGHASKCVTSTGKKSEEKEEKFQMELIISNDNPVISLLLRVLQG